ncbi:flagellar basal body P-ring formation chaperone FlgA [Sphingomonas mucosissima]|uniref:Flagella basal body P-ring formation protein FlgA n=1 Tax=Sphingomonas mucosissima TaxID=370959 RepID=A0A245ZF04_9SPHN|nr:flagellar basal body P-ring formation chaperone FlgA [Sphingomonas mucosissima]OWK28325.1 flagellar basal body P-ring biosynthesis protein FlgA [Sphingomonas mucosissima]
MSGARAFLGIAGLAGIWAALPALAAVADTVDVPVLARAVARGELLDATDFTAEPRPVAQARGAVAARDAQGKEAARNLPAGAVVRGTDITQPRLVKRGEPVTIAVRKGTLVIATPGKALSSGSAGDLVRVVALSTNRTLDAIVEKSGTVRVVAP